jgi:ribosome-associated translation inhibitor RaiA
MCMEIGRPIPRGAAVKYTERTDQLDVEIDLHQCRLTRGEIDRMIAALGLLGRQTAHFPVSTLHVLIAHNARSNDYSVKTSLELTGETLVSSDHAPQPFPAYEHCLNNLVESVKAYKERLGRVPERQRVEKHTVQPIQPSPGPDGSALDAAVSDGDYAAYRTAAFGYEEAVRKRAGRWVGRYPEVDATVGRGLTMDDLIEEVFLLAFERHGTRPRDVPYGEWLAGLIDMAVKTLQAHPDEELENVRLVRSARLAAGGPGAV